MFRREAFAHCCKTDSTVLSIHYANIEISVLIYGRCQLLGQKNQNTWTPVEKNADNGKLMYSKEILSHCHFIRYKT